MKRAVLLMTTVVSLLTAARPAQAQVSLTPFSGRTFAGSADQREFTMGAAVTFLTHSPVAIELEGGYTPDFFNEQPGFPLIAKSNVTTLMASVNVGIPINGTRAGSVRPYVVGGLGLMRTRVTSASDFFNDVTTNKMGLTAGGGAVFMFHRNLGVRADARYFRQLQDPADDDVLDVSLAHFSFWRWSLGLVIGG